MSRSEQVSTRAAAEMLGEPLNYALVHYLVRTGKLTPEKKSPRNWYFAKSAIERIAWECAEYPQKVA